MGPNRMLDQTTLLFQGSAARQVGSGVGMKRRRAPGETYALGYSASTSAGTPESWGHEPRAPPGWPSFSGG